LQVGAGAVAALSKLPQIIAIFREGGTGQLSAFTVSQAILYDFDEFRRHIC
jgi:mannose-P-dolichol utilization defect protein 1